MKRKFALYLLLPFCSAFFVNANADIINPQKSKADIKIYPRLPMASQGTFSEVSGQLQLQLDQMLSVEVVLDAQKLSFTGPAWLNKTARSKDFLDVQTYPAIKFSSAHFNKTLLTNGGSLEGSLSLRGQTKAVSFFILPSMCSEPGHGCPLTVRGQVNRRDFGMRAYRFTVKDAVDFEFTIFFEPKPL
jgi:polyisoprenoid-binding protein YceI